MRRIQKVLNLDMEVVEKLEDYSRDNKIPQSRLVEDLLLEFFKRENRKGMI